MEAFNNREIAFAIWLFIFFTYAFLKKDIRDGFISIWRAFAKKLIIIPFFLLIIYVLISIWFLWQVGLWDLSQVKSTLLWFFGIATITFFRAHEIADDPSYFRNAITDNLKIIVLIEFLINFYTFNLFVELFFIPLIAFVVILHAFSATDKKYLPVQKILDNLLAVIGILITVYAVYRLIIDFQEFAQPQTALDFIVPIILSIALLPFIFMLHAYMSYEGVFNRLHFLIKDEFVRAYAKRSALINYKFNLSSLRRWADALCREQIDTIDDINRMHKEVARIEAEERNPPLVQFGVGWSPYKISTILEDKGLKVGHYKKIYGNEWSASSNYLDIGDPKMPNNIAYYLEGDKSAVKVITLKMNINNTEERDKAHKALCELASLLHIHALGVEINQRIKRSIMRSEDIEDYVKTKIVRVKITSWRNKKGYDVIFSISNP
ncbi:MAG: hypothetical protein IBX55_20900 [Methyloprofundus sp.]|nr:hypothetical protein [Methyloprofundus sp.]